MSDKPTTTIEQAATNYRLSVEELIKHGAYGGFLVDTSKGRAGGPSVALRDEATFSNIKAKETVYPGADKGDFIRCKDVNGVLFYKYVLAKVGSDE